MASGLGSSGLTLRGGNRPRLAASGEPFFSYRQSDRSVKAATALTAAAQDIYWRKRVKQFVSASACIVALLVAAPSSAQKWVDYTPQKGYWEIRYVKVDPNKIDEYLRQAKIGWMPGEEALKKRGLIYGYQVMVSLTPASDKANVIFCVHHVSFANLDPNETRDRAIENEADALLPKAKSDAMAADFNEYRRFVGDEIYIPVDFTK